MAEALPTIEKGVPMPSIQTKSTGPRYNLMMDMDPGDSFSVSARELKTWNNTAKRVRVKHPARKYAYRKTETGYRFWRVA